MAQDNIKKIDNMEIDSSNGFVTVSVNPKLYPMPIIYSASYILIDKAFIILDGDPEKEVLIKLRPKKPCNLEELGREFNNELINYGFYSIQLERTRELRSAIVQRAMSAHDQAKCSCETSNNKLNEIAKPWNDQKGKIGNE